MARCSWSGGRTIGGQGSVPLMLFVEVVGQAGDPLVAAAADIDYEGTLSVKWQMNDSIVVAFDGKVDSFPAFEAYATVGRETKALFRSAPPEGNTVMSLLGRANRRMGGEALFSSG